MPKHTENSRERRRRRVRAKVHGTPARLRLNVFRSNEHMYAQLIDDVAGHTHAAASSLDQAIKDMGKLTKVQEASAIGKLIAERAMAKDIKKVVFDRAGYLYHGRVKAVADGARAGGLEF
ncbi:MAG: 50S ribosomal protein L18 [Thermoflexales bacterium]|jgi:large subunit ribosomal protein L18|nr:50S ribosomal protein L18 [Thermoflexales bacterium]MBP8240758.1 50S ribosomal protein L18 [Thermoflexales bacterium]